MAKEVSERGNKWTALVVAVVGAALGSSGGIAIYLRSPDAKEAVAPDRFTGTQAAALVERLNHVDQLIDTHLESHPDAINQFDRRIATLEAQYAIILQNQGRILDRLDSL